MPTFKKNHVFDEQIELFDRDADFWWKMGGPFDLLHAMNPLRISFITKCIGDVRDLRILDIGCGGGILSEPLARLGANVTGIDTSLGAIHAARAHAEMMGLNIEYQHTTIEEFSKRDLGFDLIIASEIIEHVPNPTSFLAACKQQLAPNNKGIILSTINRTSKSYLGAILGAEYILRWVPRGTHEWNRFLKPSEISGIANMQWNELKGLSLNLRSREWSFSKDLTINYIGWLKEQVNYSAP
ncbi:MAG: bifunctional 2-polyprenyl-6-hydroxyphenol methylase/3-demethylubiquinol 3-O-methyltransferase UbiG [Candidatus Paracaedibacteraceae bacterium]|nr:bifunctional 2-polyprenyl-6-hydroxyphenol methylase/3-demethylubiquinol 3-O-methyltransferase UbiG [Candidatus Paracaedibacteraceae bacterium]